MKHLLRRLRAALAAALLASFATATWSIVVVDTRTGEIAIASATCLQNFDLEFYLSVVRVGEGVAAAQSSIDATGNNRVAIWNGFQQGLSPADILAGLAATDPAHQTRQYGIVSLRGMPVSFTGSSAGAARKSVTGTIGDYRYAIQGNLLAGQIVVDAAEAAFRAASGDLGQRVMAGMEAARSMGGDGRCSCSTLLPTSCGAPPPSFTHSATTSFLVVARPGDVNGVCDVGNGCSNGGYYCNRRIISNLGAPDAVVQLEGSFLAWRGEMLTTADHYLTRVDPGAQSLPADGRTTTTVEILLRNLEDAPVLLVHPTVELELLTPGPAIATVGPDLDLGAGRHRITLTSTGVVGEAEWRVRVVHPAVTVRLWPNLTLRADPPAALHVGYDEISAAAGASVPLVVDFGPSAAGRPYLVLASSSGTTPGSLFGGILLPLNRDRLLRASLRSAGVPPFTGTIGMLDATGYALAAFTPAPGALASSIGQRFDWACVLPGAAPLVSNTGGFLITP